ncbi:sterol desaturase family protein [Umezakia ovalisporum]|jgi:sterol desaturase/sphingolipid hydroxylase (fatty acid hydroxylase superfamily)|uniref:sterol desaturase family protein n=1 Tax=Umezakia ovalisporum TaxID=75695 RepID=UPI0035B6EB9E|nr:sterol desaturase [Nostoc sp. RI_552]
MITQTLIGLFVLFLSGMVFWIWEIQDPLSVVEYRSRFPREVGAAMISAVYSIILAYFFVALVKLTISPSLMEFMGWSGLLSLPLGVRLFIAYILKDFSFYLTHWLKHVNNTFWLTHSWHHSIDQLWWLAAQRESLTDVLLFKVGFLSFPLLDIPPEIMVFVGIHYIVHDNWIHLNVKWRSWMGVLEWFYVTPRFHAVHHTQTGSHTKNLGALFTIFDRIFGTYVDPGKLTTGDIEFASGDNAVVTWRKVIGV